MPRIDSYFRRSGPVAKSKSTALHKVKKKELYGSRWQRQSKLFLLENPLCADCDGRGVVSEAWVVDHKQPHRGDYDAFWSRENWQSLCVICHNRKSAAENNGGPVKPSQRPHWIKRTNIPVTLVVGPPGSGRREYVKERMGPRDILIDFPALVRDAEDERQAVNVRNTLLGRLTGPYAKQYTAAWWIDDLPEARVRRWWSMRFGCQVVVMGADLETCRQRLRDQDRTSEIAASESWHRAYSSGGTEEAVYHG